MKSRLLFALLGCVLAVSVALFLLPRHAATGNAGSAGVSTGREPAASPGATGEVRQAGSGADAPDPSTARQEPQPSGEWVRARLAALKDSSRPLARREAEVAELARRGDARAVEVLTALGDERTYLNGAAVRALGAVRDPALKPGVEKYLAARVQHEDSAIACAAARSLAAIRGEAAIPDLALALRANRRRPDGHQEMVCSAIVKALEETGSPLAVPPLAAELERSGDKGWSLEYGSKIVHALRQLRTPEAGAAVSAYADRLEARKPADPLAGAYYAEKIAEAREAAGPGT